MIAEITVLKKRIKELERYRMHLEEMAKERTIELEETNTALRVLITKGELSDPLCFSWRSKFKMILKRITAIKDQVVKCLFLQIAPKMVFLAIVIEEW